ncbi:MAG: 1-acyl-sn-glycerol-3-phosphate acyltransferase, partial [Actinobacteria bacterium]
MGEESVAEPWFQVAKAVALPPAWLWFQWRFEHLERIPERGPALIACNHASYLDPIANAYAVVKVGRRPRFLAKDDLFDIPLVGRALAGAGQIPVSRGSGDRTPLVRAERALAAG